jgi:hypothetical protein
MLPAVTERVLKVHGYRTCFYGNFAAPGSLGTEILQPVQPYSLVWRTFDHRPRFGNNYVGLRNRLTILSEAYSYLDFKDRVLATGAFVEEILNYTAAHAGDIIDLLARTESPRTLGVEFELRALPDPVNILVSEVERKTNPRSGHEMVAVRPDSFTPVTMMDYGVFAITRSIEVPEAYVIAKPPERIVENLVTHGIVVEKVDRSRTLVVDRFVIEDARVAETMFQGHREVRVKGHVLQEMTAVEPGAILVRTSQPLRRLVFYLLDPESDDGFVTWGLLRADEILRIPRLKE